MAHEWRYISMKTKGDNETCRQCIHCRKIQTSGVDIVAKQATFGWFPLAGRCVPITKDPGHDFMYI